MRTYLENLSRLFCILTIGTALSLMTGCAKETTSTTTYAGNWKVSYEFEGVGRTNAVSFTIDSRVYIGLGFFNGTTRLNDFWYLEKNTGTWKKIADFPGAARNSAVAFAINGKGYVGTGYDGTNKLSDFWCYDPDSDSWTEVADIADFGATARYGAVGFSIGDKGYVATGYDNNYLKDLWEYDPAINTWTQKTSLSGSKRMGAVAFVYQNQAYVVTGINNGSYLTDFYKYDQASDSWTRLRNINSSNDDESYDDDYGSNITRTNASAFVLNSTGKAYLFCGSINSSVLNTNWEYDITTDLWEQKTSFEGASREGAIGFSINDLGHIACGTNGSSWFDDLWEFYPNEDQTASDNY